jgi:hypothetical protein
MAYKDKLGVEIEIGDIVAVGSNQNIRICKVYGFGQDGQPLSEILIGSAWGKRIRGDWGTAYIIIRRGDQSLPELERIING